MGEEETKKRASSPSVVDVYFLGKLVKRNFYETFHSPNFSI